MPETLHGTRRLGDFLLLAEIARGATGMVWHARRISLGRACALKLLIGGRDASESDRARFILEAEASAALDHPNIIRVHGAGEVEGHLYLEMELMAGETLADRLVAGVPSPVQAAEWARGLAEGLAHAHSRGVLHRDIKPGNVLVAEDGSLKLGDFGVARMLAQPSDLTLTFGVVGTPMYLAPEVARQGATAASTASDVFSLGAVLHEMLTGQPPRRSRDPLQVLAEVQQDPLVAPSRVRRGIPHDLDILCQRCTAEEPGRRFGSALELAEELGRHLRGEPIRSRAVSWPERMILWARRRRAVAAMAAVAAVALVAGGMVAAWQWRRARAVDERLRDRVVLGPLSDAEQFGREGLPDIALLRMAAILRQRPGHEPTRQRLSQWLALPDVCPVPRHAWMHDVGARRAGYSGDGRWIWVALDDGRAVVHPVSPAEGRAGGDLEIDGIGPEGWVALNHDGSRLMGWHGDRRLACWRAPGVPGAKPTLDWELAAVRSVAVSQDGQYGVAVGSAGQLWTWEMAAPEVPRRWPDVQLDGVDGPVGVSGQGGVVAHTRDGKTIRVLRRNPLDPGPVTEQVIASTHGVALSSLHLSPAGSWLVGGSGRQVWTWDLRTGQPLDHGRIRVQAEDLVGLTQDGRYVVTASRRGVSARFVANGGEVFAAYNLRQPLGSMGLSRGIGHMALGSEDGRLFQRQGADGGFAAGAPHASPIRSLAYSPAEDAILAAHADGAVVETTAWKGWAHVFAREVPGTPMQAQWTGAGKRVLLVSPAGIRSWDPMDPGPVGPDVARVPGAAVAAYSDAGGCVVTVAPDDPFAVQGCVLREGARPATLWREAEEVRGLWSSLGGPWLMGCGASNAWVRRWDGAQWQAAGSWKVAGVRQVVFRPGGAEACIVTEDGRAHAWAGTPGGAGIRPVEVPFAVAGVAFTPDGMRALWVSRGMEAVLARWGQPVHAGVRLAAKSDIRAHAVCDTHVVLASKRAVTVWDHRSPEVPVGLAGPFLPIDAVAVSPDGRWVAVHSDDAWLGLHEIATGMPVARPHALADRQRIPGPWSIRFTPDGRHLWGWNTNGGVFSMPMPARIPAGAGWTEVLIDLAEHAASDPVIPAAAAPAHRARWERLGRARLRGTWLPEWDRFLGP